jgi:hypothetical protein
MSRRWRAWLGGALCAALAAAILLGPLPAPVAWAQGTTPPPNSALLPVIFSKPMLHLKSCEGRLIFLPPGTSAPSAGCGDGLAYPRLTSNANEAVVFGGLAFGVEGQAAGQRVDIAPHVRQVSDAERQFRVNIKAGPDALRFTVSASGFVATRNGDPFVPDGVTIAGWTLATSSDRSRIVLSRGEERIWLTNVGGELWIEVLVDAQHDPIYGAWAHARNTGALPPDWNAGIILVRYALT